MREVTVKYYQFGELSDDVQSKVIDKMWDINVDYDWWESTYEDAERVGLKLTGFDIERHYCHGEFIDSAEKTAHLIEDEHGESTESYKTAKEYLTERDRLIDEAARDEYGEFVDENKLDCELDDLDEEFRKSILGDYRIILRGEYDYLTSKEAIIETIEANEYEFTENGKRV